MEYGIEINSESDIILLVPKIEDGEETTITEINDDILSNNLDSITFSKPNSTNVKEEKSGDNDEMPKSILKDENSPKPEVKKSVIVDESKNKTKLIDSRKSAIDKEELETILIREKTAKAAEKRGKISKQESELDLLESGRNTNQKEEHDNTDTINKLLSENNAEILENNDKILKNDNKIIENYNKPTENNKKTTSSSKKTTGNNKKTIDNSTVTANNSTLAVDNSTLTTNNSTSTVDNSTSSANNKRKPPITLSDDELHLRNMIGVFIQAGLITNKENIKVELCGINNLVESDHDFGDFEYSPENQQEYIKSVHSLNYFNWNEKDLGKMQNKTEIEWRKNKKDNAHVIIILMPFYIMNIFKDLKKPAEIDPDYFITLRNLTRIYNADPRTITVVWALGLAFHEIVKTRIVTDYKVNMKKKLYEVLIRLLSSVKPEHLHKYDFNLNENVQKCLNTHPKNIAPNTDLSCLSYLSYIGWSLDLIDISIQKNKAINVPKIINEISTMSANQQYQYEVVIVRALLSTFTGELKTDERVYNKETCDLTDLYKKMRLT